METLPSKRIVVTSEFLASINAKPINRTTSAGPASATQSTSAQPGANATPTAAKTEAGAAHSLSPLALKFLVFAFQHTTPRTYTQLHDEIGASRVERQRIENELEKGGFIQPHRIPTGKKGGLWAFPEVLDKGWAIAAGMGLGQKPAPLTRGGFIHDTLCSRALQKLAKKQGCAVAFECDFCTVRLDAKWQMTGGGFVFFQFGVSDPKHEADSILRAMKIPCVTGNSLVLVARDRGFEREAMAELKRRDPNGQWRKVVSTKLVGELLAEAMDK